MTELERGIIDLIKSAITGCKITLPETFDWDKAYEIAVNHQLFTLLYAGIVNSDISVPQKVLSNLELKAMMLYAISVKQLYELEKIYSIFDDNSIKYMPLKGAVMKFLYPKPELRCMVDADILIDYSQYEKIRSLMKQLGFEEIVASEYDMVWEKKNALHMELHRRLVGSFIKDFYAYFGDGWKFAKNTNKSRYDMSDEDFFVYIFAHYAKHYRDAGIGIRHIIDFYVYFSTKPTIDKKYIESELKKLHLLKFYQNTMFTLDVWFNGSTSTALADFITSKIFNSGSYGNKENLLLSDGVRISKSTSSEAGIKFKKLLWIIFLPYKFMKLKYPVLEKFPIMLPIMWIVRAVTFAFKKPSKLSIYKSRIKALNSEKISEYQRELNYVGLDYNFKE